jgi:hypothetical protein
MSNATNLRISRRYQMTVHAGCDRVFPLLCPVREREYLDDWTAEILFSESGVAEKGCIFQTPNAEGPPTTWYITEHDRAAGSIVFVMFTPESRVSRLDISLASIDHATTRVSLTYTHTAITPAGQAFISAFTEAAFTAKMKNFETKLNEFLASI